MTSKTLRMHKPGHAAQCREIRFKFNYKTLSGYEGDTLASALLANGIHFVGRSFKYHRPRGILGAGAEDPAGLVQLGANERTQPNARASEIELYDGLECVSQNCWPSLESDLGAVVDKFWPILTAGFYYKMFMGPPGNWMFFEKFIRRAAGMGQSPVEPDPEHYEHTNAHCDVLIVGGGPAGLSAALAASNSGLRVILVDEGAVFGGQLLAENSKVEVESMPARRWIAEAEAKLRAADNVTVLSRTCAFGYHVDNWVALWQNVQDHLPPSLRDPQQPRHRMWRVRAGKVVLATGAIERPLVFHRNDRPGIMLAGAVRKYLNHYGVRSGKRAVVVTNNNSAYETAFDLTEADIEVAEIVDTRREVDVDLRDRARYFGIPVRLSGTVINTFGSHRINKIEVGSRSENEKEKEILNVQRIDCDLVAVSGGWSPNVALFSQSRGQLHWDEDLVAFRPFRSWQNEQSIGSASGSFDLNSCLKQGHEAGVACAAAADGAVDSSVTNGESLAPVAGGREEIEYSIEPAWELPTTVSSHKVRAFVDFQNDVTSKDLKNAVAEGFTSVEHVKRYTTLGMAPDQGKTSSVNGFGILSTIMDKSMPEVGITTMRPPYKPISFGAVAGEYVGELFHARRYTPMHSWHQRSRATFEIVGDWLRVRTYRLGDETFDEAVQREAKIARTTCGVLDASTLGKIDIRGRDAAEFLNRVYTNSWLKLKIGHCRYGLMLNEDGMVFDDGVTTRLGESHFHMTTTTGGAARVLAWLEDYHQTEWSDLEVYMTSVTEQWAVAAICGPNSAALLSELVRGGGDLRPESFPFMTYRNFSIDGVPARIFRISFTGETSYEINVPARYGLWLWTQIMEKGRNHGITPYGTEAMHLLRAEKGYIIAGQDTDGTVTPVDLGMGKMVKQKADFIGKRSLSRIDTARADRRQFVGILTQDPNWVIPEGSQIIPQDQEAKSKNTTPMIGHVTSAYFSPNVGKSIALGLVEGGFDKIGETVYISRKGMKPMPATICSPDFLAQE